MPHTLTQEAAAFADLQPLKCAHAPDDIINITYEIQRITLQVWSRTKTHCSGASTLLAYALRERGYDARVRAGHTVTIVDGELLWAHHCWVQCGEWRLEPTVCQFSGRENEPLVSEYSLLSDYYQQWGNGGDWGSIKPPVVPSRQDCLRQNQRETSFYSRDGKLAKKWLRQCLALAKS